MIIQNLRTYFKYFFYSLLYRNRKALLYGDSPKSHLSIINNANKENLIFKRIIWTYWDGDVVPYIVQKCIKRIRTINPQFEVNFLNSDTLSHYLPDFHLPNTDMPLANQADLIRLELLYRYGGIWLDATVILNESLDWVLPIMDRRLYDCIGFWKTDTTIDNDFPVIESWFLCAPPQNDFIKRWLDTLRPLGYLGANRYFENISRRKDYDLIRQNIDRPTYLLVYLSQQIAMRSDVKFNICYQIADETAFYYQEKLDWDFKKINFEFMLKETINLPPLVKLISHNFSDIDYCKVNGFINKKSIIGNILHSN